MALTRWEPAGALTTLRRDIDRLIDDFFGRGAARMWGFEVSEPVIDVVDTADAVIVKAQVPGVTTENLHLSITDTTLTLKGERKEEESKEEKNYRQQEFRYGSFERTVALPEAVQSDKASAQLKDGVLEIRIPKSEQAKAKAIPIQAS